MICENWHVQIYVITPPGGGINHNIPTGKCSNLLGESGWINLIADYNLNLTQLLSHVVPYVLNATYCTRRNFHFVEILVGPLNHENFATTNNYHLPLRNCHERSSDLLRKSMFLQQQLPICRKRGIHARIAFL